jgi:putative ABC transport system permease protein
VPIHLAVGIVLASATLLAGIALSIRRGRAIRRLAWRSICAHRAASAVTIPAAALGAGLIIAVVSISSQTQAAFQLSAGGYDAVVGARGSQLQLVLNSVFHLEASPGNLQWTDFEAVAADPRVRRAVPYALGDNYFGYRLVGTTPARFEPLPDEPGSGLPLAAGERFVPGTREAVLGSVAADATGLRIGDTFQPFHGLDYVPGTEHAERYTVVGLLEPTNTPADRVIWIPIEGVWSMPGHVGRNEDGDEFEPTAGGGIPVEFRQVSAVLLDLEPTPGVGLGLSWDINRRGKRATIAWPIAAVMSDFYAKTGWVVRVLELVSVLVVIVAGAGIAAAIANALAARRRQLAVLRAIGARRRTLSAAVVTEAGMLSGIGGLLGLLIGPLIVAVAAGIIRAQTGIVIDPLAPHPVHILVPLGTAWLGALMGLIPAIAAYRTDVAGALATA